jgi:hypothetical protein
MLRTLVLSLEKIIAVRVLEFKFSAPKVSVTVFAVAKSAPRTKESVEVLIVMFLPTAVASVVALPVPELASNITSSPTTGAEAPAAPPLVADQLAVDVEFHVPVPPTQ